MSLSSKIGIPGVTEPSKKCDDPNCPSHGFLKVRGRIFTGTVVKNRMTNAITVQIDFDRFNKKYQRYERRNSKTSVHLPPCIEVVPGTVVRFMQCRKISKTISSVVIQKLE
jgi:small subunit ribosomal protein S17